jgi:hypothetical protein
MSNLGEVIQFHNLSGEPARLGRVTVTPQNQAVTLRLPFGGFVFNRPVAVLVEQDGETQRIPVLDVTRMAQLGLWVSSFVLLAIATAIHIRTRRIPNE